MRLCDGRGDAWRSAQCGTSRPPPPPPAGDDERFPKAVSLLTKRNQQLIDFHLDLEPSVTKLVCVRTSSKDSPPPL